MGDLERFFMGGLVAAGLIRAYRYISDNYTIEVIFPNSKKANAQDTDMPILDCPMCGMPCVPGPLVQEHDPIGNVSNYYAVSCLGDHDTIAVTQAWLMEQLEKL